MAQTVLSFDQRLTPMMEQYRSIKKTLPPDTILFFRLGDFYEMFFEDAVRASDLLNITLTGRDGGPAGRVPMCGVPHHSFQPYVRALLDRNLKVAICEQIGDPQAAKGLVERKVTRIITPATFLDEEGKPAGSETIVAVAVGPAECALAALELGTGDFSVRQAPRDRLGAELALLQPRELILPKSLSADPALEAPSNGGGGPSRTLYEEWVFDPAQGLQLLKERLRLGSGRALDFADCPLAVAAAGAVLYYLRDHLHSALEHVRPPVLLGGRERMALDRQTVRNLELVSGLNGQGRGGSLLACLDQTLTPMGSRLLQGWIVQPLLSAEKIRFRQEGVA